MSVEQQEHHLKKVELSSQYLWQSSVACFILAGLTGFLYRLGMTGWIPGDLSLGNIRHAHSHLMFFGWAVPLPLYIIMERVRQKTKSSNTGLHWMKYSIGVVLLFGLAAYPFFLLYGYRPVPIGAASQPLSVIFSGLVMIGWYGFMIGYWKNRSSLQKEDILPWVDGALVLLAVCSLGAWGVAVVQELAPGSHLMMKSMTHFFLATFTEGWVVLVLAAILTSEIDIEETDWLISPHMALAAIVIGAPLTFPYGISESLLTPMLLTTARIGGGVAALGLLAVGMAVIKSGKWKHPIWIWPVVLLILKGAMQLMASVVPSSFWLADPGLRVLYLHMLLLGGLTLLSIGWLQVRSNVEMVYFRMVAITVSLTILSLLMLTGLWPQLWSGTWIIYALATGALLPILAISLLGIKLTFDQSLSS